MKISYYFNPWTGKNFVITESSVRDCSDLGKNPCHDIAECREAASIFGFTWGGDKSFDFNPKSCFVWDRKTVHWNTHETGSKREKTLSICKLGKYACFSLLHLSFAKPSNF